MNSLLLTLDLQEDTILLNKGILDALDHPRQVQIMINEELGSLLLRACTVDDLQAIVVPENHVMQFEIGGRSLLKKIRRIAGWVNDEPRICSGEYLPMHHAIRFDLMSAMPTVIPNQ
ncbi:MAG: hypothetical protein IJL88_03045 [Clostridia bacterium]|nr:hypothetical protein [Clostridia bacterium]